MRLNKTFVSYLVSIKGKKEGPYKQEQIVEMMVDGRLSPDDMIKINGSWTPLATVPWLSDVVQTPADAATLPTDWQPETETPADIHTEGAPKKPQGPDVTCPHCWHRFHLSDVNYIARHLDLHGDPILGPEAQMRFLPTTFNAQGYAIDAKGMVCQDMACPHCHLRIPEAIVDTPSLFFSIVGAPASGKSYYLTAMIWQVRAILAQRFNYTFNDTDATFNSVLNNYEQILFLNRDRNNYVALPKTELQGSNFSNQILLNGMSVDLPLPFIFTLQPNQANQHSQAPNGGIRNIVLYDNAGEHFEPGRDQVTNLATQHLVYSESIAFLYDPIKDSRMVVKCNQNDPQVSQVNQSVNQLVLLNEMIARIKKYAALRGHAKYPKPLFIVVPKYDAWQESFPFELNTVDFCFYDEEAMTYHLDIGVITSISFTLRENLMMTSPEVVTACESFFSTVYYIPVSALGRIPEYDQERNMIAIKPHDLRPVWAEVPMLMQFWHAGIIPAVISNFADATPVDKYQFINDQLVYTPPGSRERQSVPKNYWGKTVYSATSARFITFPNAPAVPAPETHQSSIADDEFWQQ